MSSFLRMQHFGSPYSFLNRADISEYFVESFVFSPVVVIPLDYLVKDHRESQAIPVRNS